MTRNPLDAHPWPGQKLLESSIEELERIIRENEDDYEVIHKEIDDLYEKVLTQCGYEALVRRVHSDYRIVLWYG